MLKGWPIFAICTVVSNLQAMWSLTMMTQIWPLYYPGVYWHAYLP